jgi:Na+-transporting methylmalonyl-CoA/oxaloacetate decarboxylase gamma subunit
MDAIENIALIIFLLALGVGLAVAVLIGFIYVVEFMND